MVTQCRAIQWIIVGIAIGLLAVVAFTNSGCGTIGGMRDDVADMIDHSRKHLITDPQ